ncbi:ribonuclease R [Thiobacter aerophilum]|uniref:Ribonuclease R n=1 Tax=Thiobacter aerophilum TaxID=3121275 RepID=A0ABV0EFV9_9BURK
MKRKPAKLPAVRLADPYYQREQEKYGHPLPSREYILQKLKEHGVPIGFEEFARMMGIAPHEMEIFARRIDAMERQGQLMRNRKGALCMVDKLHLIKGRVQGHPDGFGFVVPEAGGEDVFLSPREMQGVMHGDLVMVRVTGIDRRGRPEGSVVEVLERANKRIVGRLMAERGILFVVPEDKRITQDILVEPAAKGKAKPGQVVVIELTEQPSRHSQPIGRIVEVLGDYGDPGMEIEIAVRKHNLPYEFSREIERLCKKFPKGVRKEDFAGREDIRELPLVTIDGETARDFDDAVYCQKRWRGWRLVVAIADVSHYVLHGDPLDREALNRGNSVYFPRRVIPMLPEVLSNGLCSINPQVDRLCMVCDMEISSSGEIKKYRFYPGVMHSHARLTYNQVWEMLQQPQGEMARSHAALLPHLQNLHKLYQALAKARVKRGAIDFETIETQMIFNDQGKIERIVPVERNDAHRLIEECMLAANVCASDFLQRHKHPALYRIHQGPTPEKLEALREFLKNFGLTLGGGDHPHAKDYAKLLEKIKGRPDAQLLQTVMLRSLQQAVYSPDNVGHFGLAYESYTHFTSPIRRYPDLLIHRAIKAVLAGKEYKPGDWHELGLHCSMTERRADEATRDVEQWLKCYYMQDRIGEEFEGTISGVTSFGIFVALDGVYVEGMVHVSELGNDYFTFDAAQHRLIGERTHKVYRLADRLRVRVARVSLETSRIDFVPVETGIEPRVAGSARRPTRGERTTEGSRAAGAKRRTRQRA